MCHKTKPNKQNQIVYKCTCTENCRYLYLIHKLLLLQKHISENMYTQTHKCVHSHIHKYFYPK